MNTKRVIITSLVSSIGIAALGLSFSFAWYNSSENLFLDSFVIRIAGSPELLISTENDIDTMSEYLQYHITDNEENRLKNASPFQPVSSMFKDTWLNEKKTDPVFYEYSSSSFQGDDYTHEPRKSVCVDGYYSEHLFLHCNSKATMTFDSESLAVQPILEKNEEYAEELLKDNTVLSNYDETWTREEIKEDILTKLNNLVKCMRVSILIPDEDKYQYMIIDPFKDEDVLLGGRLDLDHPLLGDKYYDHYFVDSDTAYETIYGEVNDRGLAVYDDARAEDSEEPIEYNSFASRTKAGVHGFNLEKSLENGMVIEKEDSITAKEAEESLAIKMDPKTTQEVVVTIYMEGWDTDCVNHHMGSSFDLGLKFKLKDQEKKTE